MTFVLGRHLSGRTTARRAAFERLWQLPRVRRSTRVLTAAWGAALVGEAAVRIALSFALAPSILLAVSPVMAAAVFGPMAIWTMRWVNRSRQMLTATS